MLFIVKPLKKSHPSLVIVHVSPPLQTKQVLLTAGYISFVYFYLSIYMCVIYICYIYVIYNHMLSYICIYNSIGDNIILFTHYMS